MAARGGNPVTIRAKSSQITLSTNITANDSLLIYQVELFSSPAKNTVRTPEVKTDSGCILPSARGCLSLVLRPGALPEWGSAGARRCSNKPAPYRLAGDWGTEVEGLQKVTHPGGDS